MPRMAQDGSSGQALNGSFNLCLSRITSDSSQNAAKCCS